jgi:pseudaminic acid cytidylyltransferase
MSALIDGSLCLIPARGGSKRIPRKNLRALAGKPLLAHSVEVALRSGLFEAVVVSSEDDEILAVAEAVGALADRRPAQLASDQARNVDVVEEFLRRDPARWRRVALLQPAAPFRTIDDLRGAWELLVRHGGFVVSVTLYETSPNLALDLRSDGTLAMRHPETYAGSIQSQVLAPAWRPNGAIYALETEVFLRAPSFFGQPLRAWPMPPERSLDLDYPFQWEMAETLMRLQG